MSEKHSTNLSKFEKAVVKNFFMLKLHYVEPSLKHPGHK